MPQPRYAWAVAMALCPAACGGTTTADRPEADATEDAGLRGQVLVSAAASLTDAFADIGAAFEAAHPGVDVTLNLAGSSTLRMQVLEGAPADVFASANTSNMDRVVEAELVRGGSRVFAHNLLQIAVPAGNPAGVVGLEDFADEALRLGLCVQSAPCGEFARRAFDRAGVDPRPDTNEPDVRALLTKIELGELDAGITYVTDVAARHGAVEGVDISLELNVEADYPIAVLTGGPNPEAAAAFVRFVLSDPGRTILARHGFGLP